MKCSIGSCSEKPAEGGMCREHFAMLPAAFAAMLSLAYDTYAQRRLAAIAIVGLKMGETVTADQMRALDSFLR